MENSYRYGFYPPYRFPPFYYRNHNYNRQSRLNHANYEKKMEKKENFNKEDSQKRISQSAQSFDNPVFEIFGIKLFFDDILLISLIFFLYNEGVQDTYLFIALILLLLS